MNLSPEKRPILMLVYAFNMIITIAVMVFVYLKYPQYIIPAAAILFCILSLDFLLIFKLFGIRKPGS